MAIDESRSFLFREQKRCPKRSSPPQGKAGAALNLGLRDTFIMAFCRSLGGANTSFLRGIYATLNLRVLRKSTVIHGKTK